MNSTSKLVKFLDKLKKIQYNFDSIRWWIPCLISPVKGVMLKDDVKLNDLLILKDIPIDQINNKSFFSNVKYGKLGKKLYPNKIFNLIVSDDSKMSLNLFDLEQQFSTILQKIMS